MRKHKSRRILAIVVSIMMVMTLLPASVFATGALQFDQDDVLFREQRAPSQWFYNIGAGARDAVANPETHGHYGTSPTGAVTFVDGQIPTFTLNVTECATQVAIDIAGLIVDRNNFVLNAAWQDVGPPDPANNFRDWMVANNTLYTTVDAGWGLDHMPAYFIVGTPDQDDTRILVMVVDGVEFHVVINRVAAFDEDGVMFREQRDPSGWFYNVGAGARDPVANPGNEGHYGASPDGAITFEDCPIPTFTLNVTVCATQVAIDIAGLIADRLDFVLMAQVLGNPLQDFTDDVHVYTTVDDGWGAGHLPAYFVVNTPAQGESRTIVMEVDGVLFHVVINRIAAFDEDGVMFREQREPSGWFYNVGAGARDPVANPGNEGHYGASPDGAILFDECTNTFTLNVTKCATQVAVDIAGLIADRLDFVLMAQVLGNPLQDFTDDVHVYTTVDPGWGAGHMPAYFVVNTPAQGESRTIVMEVDGILFHVVINRAAAFDEDGVMFREQRDPSGWFYNVGAGARDPVANPGNEGHYGASPDGAVTFIECPIPTFTLNVTKCATEVAIDIAGLIADRLDFVLMAQVLGNPLQDFTDDVHVYTTVDPGWGAGHMPAYFVVNTPAQGESRTIVMEVDGILFHVVINRAAAFDEDGVMFREQRDPSGWFYNVGAGARDPIANPGNEGHYGASPDGAITFVDCPIPTFTLNVTKCATEVAIDIAGLIVDRLDFVLMAQVLGNPLQDFTDDVHVYTTVDAGWGAGHMPAYFVVNTPAQGESRTIVMEVDGILFHVVIYRAAPTFVQGDVMFREQRDPSGWFYRIGAIARDPDVYTDPLGHFGTSPDCAITFVDCPIPTFTLNVTECATQVAIDIAGLIEDRDDFVLNAAWQDVGPPDPATNFRDWMVANNTLYTTVDDGWGIGHLPAYFVVNAPAPGESRTLVMIVDGVEFHVVINRAPIGTLTLTPDTVTVDNANLVVTSTVTGGTGPITITNNNLPSAVTVAVNQDTGVITLTGVRPDAGQATISGTFELTVNRGCIYEILIVHVNLTPLPGQQNGGWGGGGGGVTPPEVTPPQVPGDPFVPDHIWFVRGYPDGSFRPGQSITRAEVSMIIWRLLVSDAKYAERANNFSDVNTGWYARAVSYLAFRGIVVGYEDGTFRPNAPITRAELVTMMSRFWDLDDSGTNNFSDVVSTHWAFAYIVNAATKGWVEGFPDGTFRPGNATSRAEAVTIINRVLERIPNPVTINYHLNGYVYERLGTNRLFNDITNGHWAFYQIMEAAIEHEFERDAQGREVWTEVSVPWLDFDTPRL